MQKHVHNYLKHYNQCWDDFGRLHIRCEVCWMEAVDLHHIIPRSKFWKNRKEEQDRVENIIALCRFCHEKAHFQREPYLQQEELQLIHNNNL